MESCRSTRQWRCAVRIRRWLASKGQLTDARRELRKLRAEAETEQALAELADEVAAETARQGSVWDMLRSRVVRAELTLGTPA